MPHKRNTKSDCQHIDAAGRRCRMPRAKGSDTFCRPHLRQQQTLTDSEAIAAELLSSNTDFNTAAAINESLSNLFILTALDRVSPRKAAILAYIGQLLVGTLPMVRREETLAENRARLFGHLEKLRDAKVPETPASKLVGEICREALGDRKVATPDQKVAAPDRNVATPHQKIATPDQKVATPDQNAAREAAPQRLPSGASTHNSAAASFIDRPWPVHMTGTGNYSG